MLTIHKKQGKALVALLILPLGSTALVDGPPTNLAILVDPPAPSGMARYFARASNCEPWSEPSCVGGDRRVLPRLAESANHLWTGSREVLAVQTRRLIVLRMVPTGWSDLGHPERVLAALRAAGLQPPWMKRWKALTHSVILDELQNT